MAKLTPGRTLHSGELAAITGVSRDALRYYERKQLLPAAQRTAGGYRLYQPEAAARVMLIRAALSIGFTVEELGDILSARDRGMAPCQQVYSLAVEKAKVLEARIAEMESLLKALRTAINSWGRKLKSTGPNQRAGLLEMFVANHPESARAISPLVSPGLKSRLQKKRGLKQ